MKDGISQVIVNVEAQKDEPTGYHILNWDLFENWNKSHYPRSIVIPEASLHMA